VVNSPLVAPASSDAGTPSPVGGIVGGVLGGIAFLGIVLVVSRYT